MTQESSTNFLCHSDQMNFEPSMKHYQFKKTFEKITVNIPLKLISGISCDLVT